MNTPLLRPVPTGLGVAAKTAKRVLRRPRHPHHGRFKPHVLQPFCIAPVLAGETLQNVLLQDRVVTDPVKGRLIGWWLEHWYFYVPLSCIQSSVFTEPGHGVVNNRTPVIDMLMNQQAPLVAETYATDATNLSSFYEYDAGAETGQPMVQWLRAITNTVALHYFCDEGVTPPLIDGLPLLKMNAAGWTDSVFKMSELPDEVLSLPINTTPDPDVAELEGVDLEGYYNTFLAMRQQTMSDITFADYLKSYGVKPQQVKEVKPELVLYRKAWSYPTNTVGTSGDDLGVPSSAVSWSVQDRDDKNRFFAEPGFIVGFTCARPKLYLARQRAYAAMHMGNAFSWLPASLAQNVEISLKAIAAGQGVLGGASGRDTDAYIFDMRDLLIRGDQFVHGVALDGTATSLHVALDPHEDDTHDESKYIDATDQMACFTDTVNGRIEHDGMTSFAVKGTQVDQT